MSDQCTQGASEIVNNGPLFSVPEHVSSEAREEMNDVAARQATGNSSEQARIDRTFGTCSVSSNTETLSGAAQRAILAKLADRPVPAQESSDSTNNQPDAKTLTAARDFQERGRRELEASHRDLKVTIDGSPVQIVNYRDRFQVTQTISARQLAEQQTGPKATPEQIEAFAQQIIALNHRPFVATDRAMFTVGSTIRMPGQMADGGIYSRGGGSTRIDWSDGSHLENFENGRGQAFYRKGDTSVDINWNPNDIKSTMYTATTSDSREHAIEGSGRSYERVWVTTNQRTGDGDWLLERVTTQDDKGRTFVREFTPGKNNPDRIVVTNPDKSTVTLKPSANGEYVSDDGKFGMHDNDQFFAITKESDGTITRTYDTGVEKLNSAGQMLRAEGTDDWGRKVVYEYQAGKNNPFRVTIDTKDSGSVALNRQRDGSYSAPLKDNDGNTVGSINHEADGRLVFRNDREKSVRTELKDGTTVEMQTKPDGDRTMTYKRGNSTYELRYDSKGQKSSETLTGDGGRVMTIKFAARGKQVESIDLEDKDGSKTQLKFDPKAKAFIGDRVDVNGRVLEHVTSIEDKLVFVNSQNAEVRAEKFIKPNNAMPHLVHGRFDRNSGTFSFDNPDGTRTVESFSPGRTDIVKRDGTVSGTTISGDTSTLAVNGEARVMHADETGVRLNADGTIDRWGPRQVDNADKEAMSPEAAKFLSEHKDIDRRDFAEIHRRFEGKAEKLAPFYQALGTIDGANNLSEQEKTALRRDIMHHVAYPGEIYQGRSPSCNVSVVQRDMAMTDPAKYVSQIVNAVSDRAINTADGIKVPLDVNNLKLQDSSGRDLASRIFQTMTLTAEFYPRMDFRNTEDGVGRLYRRPPDGKPIVFEGLNLPQIAEARYKLTGEEKAIALVDNLAELRVAFAANGGGPMITAVDGSKPPFENNGPVGSEGTANHVTTIVGLETGRRPKVFLHNQWGLASDHSTTATAIDAAKLLGNMRSPFTFEGVTVNGPAMVLVKGDHTRAYQVKGNRLVVDSKLSATVKQGTRAVPGSK